MPYEPREREDEGARGLDLSSVDEGYQRTASPRRTRLFVVQCFACFAPALSLCPPVLPRSARPIVACLPRTALRPDVPPRSASRFCRRLTAPFPHALSAIHAEPDSSHACNTSRSGLCRQSLGPLRPSSSSLPVGAALAQRASLSAGVAPTGAHMDCTRLRDGPTAVCAGSRVAPCQRLGVGEGLAEGTDPRSEDKVGCGLKVLSLELPPAREEFVAAERAVRIGGPVVNWLLLPRAAKSSEKGCLPATLTIDPCLSASHGATVRPRIEWTSISSRCTLCRLRGPRP